jgi:hypothetical protein
MNLRFHRNWLDQLAMLMLYVTDLYSMHIVHDSVCGEQAALKDNETVPELVPVPRM